MQQLRMMSAEDQYFLCILRDFDLEQKHPFVQFMKYTSEKSPLPSTAGCLYPFTSNTFGSCTTPWLVPRVAHSCLVSSVASNFAFLGRRKRNGSPFNCRMSRFCTRGLEENSNGAKQPNSCLVAFVSHSVNFG